MKATRGRRGRWLIAICGMAFLFTGTGCSSLIASAGRASLADFAPGSTRQEVREAWGEPDVSETRDDGSRVETYHIRKRASSLREEGLPGGAWWLPRGVLVLVAFEVVATGKAIYDRANAEMYDHAFVYGPDERLLYSYDTSTPPAQRFYAVRRPLAELRWKQLENGECPIWSACITSYVGELRRRAAIVGYTLPPEEEENFQRLLEIAKDVDEGRNTKGEGLIGIAGQLDRVALAEVFWGQLENDRCPRWIGCVAFYVEGLRRRGAVLGHALSSEDAENFKRLLEIARDVDGGKITQEEALNRLRSCVNVMRYYSRGSC
jgi:hypothetical protein